MIIATLPIIIGTQFIAKETMFFSSWLRVYSLFNYSTNTNYFFASNIPRNYSGPRCHFYRQTKKMIPFLSFHHHYFSYGLSNFNT